MTETAANVIKIALQRVLNHRAPQYFQTLTLYKNIKHLSCKAGLRAGDDILCAFPNLKSSSVANCKALNHLPLRGQHRLSFY